jgi:putative molybdopterin biosynthesis protein
VIGDKPVVVLPGFPTSAIFTFHAFVVPVIRAFSGLSAETAEKIKARVPVRIASELGRREFALVALVQGEDGAVAFPTAKGSGSVTSFSQADGFIEIDAMASAFDADENAEVTLIGSGVRVPDLVIVGSHDIALDVVVGALAMRGITARVLAVGSLGGVAALRRGESDIAPLHLVDPATGQYNKHFAGDGLTLVPGWQRNQGIVFRRGDARFVGQTAEQALKTALSDRSCMMVNRNAGAGTRVLIDQLLGSARPPGYANQPKSHNAVAAAVEQGRADWGVGIEPVAKLYGLGFIAVAPEQYDFLISDRRRERPVIRAFLDVLRDPATRQRISALGMRLTDV